MRVLLLTNQVKRYNSGYRVVIESLQELGHEVLWAANFSAYAGEESDIPCEHCNISVARNPLHPSNLRAYRQIMALIKKNRPDVIYCSTPIGGLLGRIAGWRSGVDRIFYAAHGFAFYRGAPWWWNCVFRGEERWLARVTDVLITINDEDMAAARTFKLRKGGKVYQVGGAGIEDSFPSESSRGQTREKLGVPEDAIVLVSAGALNRRKNYKPVIKAVAALKRDDVYYLICGEGPYRDRLRSLARELGLEKRVLFLGYRMDVADIMRCADVFVLSSLREGLPRVTMEAMAVGLPCVVSNIRGNRDLIEDGKTGILCEAGDARQYAQAIRRLAENKSLRDEMSRAALSGGVLRQYTSSAVYQQMRSIFAAELGRVSGDEGAAGDKQGEDVCLGLSECDPAAARTGAQCGMGG